MKNKKFITSKFRVIVFNLRKGRDEPVKKQRGLQNENVLFLDMGNINHLLFFILLTFKSFILTKNFRRNRSANTFILHLNGLSVIPLLDGHLPQHKGNDEHLSLPEFLMAP